MASWKKMAEAFGRALGRPDIRNEMNTIGKNSKQGIKDRQELFDTVNRSAVNNGAEDEFMTGLMRAEDDNTEIARRAGNRDMSYDERQREFDKRTDERTDESLSKTEVDRINGDLWDRAFIAADKDLQAEKLWHLIGEMRSKGATESDILNYLKAFGK